MRKDQSTQYVGLVFLFFSSLVIRSTFYSPPFMGGVRGGWGVLG